MALTLLSRGSAQSKVSADPLTVSLTGSVAVGDLMIIATATDNLQGFTSITDNAIDSKNIYVKVADVRNDNGSFVQIYLGFCHTAMTSANNLILNWAGTPPVAQAVVVTVVRRNTTRAGWKWRLGSQKIGGMGNGTSFALNPLTASSGMTTDDSLFFMAIGWEHNTAVFNAGSGFTEGAGIGTSGGTADSNQRVFTQWRTIAGGVGYDLNGNFGTNSADWTVAGIEIRNTNEFIVGGSGQSGIVNFFPGAEASARVHLSSSFSKTATSYGTVSGYNLRSTFTKTASSFGSSLARLRSTLSGTGSSSGNITEYRLSGEVTASGQTVGSSTGTLIATLRSGFTALAAGIGTAAVLLGSPCESQAISSGAASAVLRSSFGNITGFAVCSLVNPKLRSTLISESTSSGSMVYRLRSTFQTQGSGQGTSYVKILATCAGQGTSICTTGVHLRSIFQTNCASTGLVVVRLRSTLLSSGTSAGALVTGGFPTATLVGTGTGTGRLAPRLRSSCTSLAGAMGTLAPTIFVRCSALSIGTGTMVCRLRTPLSGGASSTNTMTWCVRSTFSKTAIGTGTMACRLRSALSGTGVGMGALSATLRTGFSKTANSAGTATARLRSTLSCSGISTGTVNTAVVAALSGSLSATLSISNSAFVAARALMGSVTATGSVATAALPVAFRLNGTVSAVPSLSNSAFLATKPLGSSLSCTASVTGLTSLARSLGCDITAALSIASSPMLLRAVRLEGNVAAVLEFNTPDLFVQQGVFVILSGIVTAGFSLNNPVLLKTQYPRSPPDRVVVVEADDRTIVHEG